FTMWTNRFIQAVTCVVVLGVSACCEVTPNFSSNAAQALAKEDYATAERLYRSALAEDPQSFEALNNLGITLFLEGKETQAIHYFSAALQQRFSPATFALLATAKCRTRDVEGARPMLARIKIEKISEARILALIAPCFVDTGDPIGAI